ncbi:MAG: ABC transporter substrate-binding protein [Candidatus Rokubacteria bacterium]|nr:ABC transporter substrate-binding protein [Candidatus Rokubacteria bacterium]
MSMLARSWVAAAFLCFTPLFAAAQEARRPYRIGVLNEAWSANHPTVEGLKAGLRERGLEEGRNVVFDIRFTEGKSEATPGAAGALVQSGVDLIFTSNEAATLAAKVATQKIPVVFTLVGDPVAAGIVKKLAHPEANLTGVSSLTTELVPKRLEALKTLMPSLRRVWAIYHGGDLPSSAAIVKALDVRPRLGLELVPRPGLTPEQLDEVLKRLRPGDALLAPDIATMDIPAVILEASLASRIPAVFSAELWVTHGGLVSYGADYRAQGVQAARLVAKILGGTRPQDLPVEGAEKITLSVNVKTATLLGLTVPRKILLRADMLRR